LKGHRFTAKDALDHNIIMFHAPLGSFCFRITSIQLTNDAGELEQRAMDFASRLSSKSSSTYSVLRRDMYQSTVRVLEEAKL
jgi:enoyl-CoA hydratase/carnithine racemase